MSSIGELMWGWLPILGPLTNSQQTMDFDTAQSTVCGEILQSKLFERDKWNPNSWDVGYYFADYYPQVMKTENIPWAIFEHPDSFIDNQPHWAGLIDKSGYPVMWYVFGNSVPGRFGMDRCGWSTHPVGGGGFKYTVHVTGVCELVNSLWPIVDPRLDRESNPYDPPIKDGYGFSIYPPNRSPTALVLVFNQMNITFPAGNPGGEFAYQKNLILNWTAQPVGSGEEIPGVFKINRTIEYFWSDPAAVPSSPPIFNTFRFGHVNAFGIYPYLFGPNHNAWDGVSTILKAPPGQPGYGANDYIPKFKEWIGGYDSPIDTHQWVHIIWGGIKPSSDLGTVPCGDRTKQPSFRITDHTAPERVL